LAVDFFARQDRARRTSRALVGVFLLAFVVVAAATTAAIAVALRVYMENHALLLGTESWSAWLAAHTALVVGIGGATLATMSVASLYRAATLARGGGQVARMLGASPVTPDDADPLRRRLHNVVEEMALASGLPVPEVYVLEQESGINAFAAGLRHSDAAIAVTRGALERLERAELSGVVAHEFSHILNGDMRLNQQLIGFSFGILALSLCGRWLLRTARYGRRGRNSGGVAAALVIGLALTIIGAIGVLLSRLIKAGVARERERLADAAAVQFTREPEGLAGALKKIGGYTARLASVETEEISHMLFEPMRRGWLATHPPLIERIRALDPGFDPAAAPAVAAPGHGPAPAAAEPALTAPLAAASAVPSEQLLARTGTSRPAEVGGALRGALPDELYSAAHSREGSFLLALAFAFGASAAVRRRQKALLESQLGAERAQHCANLRDALDRLPAALTLALLELAAPALRQRPSEQIEYLFELIARSTELDGARRLIDYVHLRVLALYLREGRRTAAANPRALPVAAALRSLLEHVAVLGHESATAARAAFAAGWARIAHGSAAPPSSGSVPDFARLDAALERLAAEAPATKRRVLVAVLATIEHDGRIAPPEIELCRAVAVSLGCPMPPAVEVASRGGSSG
jgi:Zn-dependent protease with chaperone function